MDRNLRNRALIGTRGRHRRQPGFTLLEVLVALAILTTTMTALVLAGTHRADSISYLRDRTIATWIASDRLTELRLEPTWPATGTRSGEIETFKRTWRWHAEIRETPDERIREVEVTISDAETDESIARLVGYVGEPQGNAS